MSFKCYSNVQIINNKYEDMGITIGNLGVILDVYETGDYEVQFLDSDGELSDIFFSVKDEDIIAVSM